MRKKENNNMNIQEIVELALYVPVAFSAILLIFIAGVLQNVMNHLTEVEFKHFLELLYRFATRSPFMLIVSSITFVGVIPYYIIYGFGNIWFTIGFALWVITSIVSKVINLPIYSKVGKTSEKEVEQLHILRVELSRGNKIRAALNLITALIMPLGLFL